MVFGVGVEDFDGGVVVNLEYVVGLGGVIFCYVVGCWDLRDDMDWWSDGLDGGHCIEDGRAVVYVVFHCCYVFVCFD